MSREEIERAIRDCDLQRKIILRIREVIDSVLGDLERQLVEERRKALEELIEAEKKASEPP